MLPLISVHYNPRESSIENFKFKCCYWQTLSLSLSRERRSIAPKTDRIRFTSVAGLMLILDDGMRSQTNLASKILTECGTLWQDPLLSSLIYPTECCSYIAHVAMLWILANDRLAPDRFNLVSFVYPNAAASLFNTPSHGLSHLSILWRGGHRDCFLIRYLRQSPKANSCIELERAQLDRLPGFSEPSPLPVWIFACTFIIHQF